MSKAVSAKIQSNGNVYLYNEIGQYVGSRKPNSGKATSAVMNGSQLVIQTDRNKTEVYNVSGSSITYAYSR